MARAGDRRSDAVDGDALDVERAARHAQPLDVRDEVNVVLPHLEHRALDDEVFAVRELRARRDARHAVSLHRRGDERRIDRPRRRDVHVRERAASELDLLGSDGRVERDVLERSEDAGGDVALSDANFVASAAARDILDLGVHPRVDGLLVDVDPAACAGDDLAVRRDALDAAHVTELLHRDLPVEVDDVVFPVGAERIARMEIERHLRRRTLLVHDGVSLNGVPREAPRGIDRRYHLSAHRRGSAVQSECSIHAAARRQRHRGANVGRDRRRGRGRRERSGVHVLGVGGDVEDRIGAERHVAVRIDFAVPDGDVHDRVKQRQDAVDLDVRARGVVNRRLREELAKRCRFGARDVRGRVDLLAVDRGARRRENIARAPVEGCVRRQLALGWNEQVSLGSTGDLARHDPARVDLEGRQIELRAVFARRRKIAAHVVEHRVQVGERPDMAVRPSSIDLDMRQRDDDVAR